MPTEGGTGRDARHDLIVVGASAGGVEALRRLVAPLPANLEAAILVVLHLPSNAHSVLPTILGRAGPLPVRHASPGEPIDRGVVYVAPPDFHLLVGDSTIDLLRGPSENGHRPAIDPLFRSAAAHYGSRVIGVVLSGVLDDGTAGLLAIAEAGGVTVVQEPTDALYPAMPLSAIENVPVDVIAPIDEIGDDLVRLIRGDVKFHCRADPSWTPRALPERPSGALEQALRTALRALSERADLVRRLRDDAERRQHRHAHRLFGEQLTELEHDADVIRAVLRRPEPVAATDVDLADAILLDAALDRAGDG